MNWFLVNIALPMGVPVLFMALVRLANLSPHVLARAKLMGSVADGQLGWVAMAFAGASSYDIADRLLSHQPNLPSWTGLLLGASCSILAMGGLLAALGTLYPVSGHTGAGWRAWLMHYRLFVATFALAMGAGAGLASIHFALPPLC